VARRVQFQTAAPGTQLFDADQLYLQALAIPSVTDVGHHGLPLLRISTQAFLKSDSVQTDLYFDFQPDLHWCIVGKSSAAANAAIPKMLARMSGIRIVVLLSATPCIK
jgi:hypothetical protein